MYKQVCFASLKDFFNKFVQQPEVVIAQLAGALGNTQKAHAFATEFVNNVAKDRVEILTKTLRPMIEAFEEAKGLDLSVIATYGKAITTFMPKFSGALQVNEINTETWEVAVFFLTKEPAQEKSAFQLEFHSGAAALKFTTVPASTASVGDDSDDLSNAIDDALGGGSEGGTNGVNLPPGLESGFGGVDLTKAAFDPLAIRAGVGGLFDVRTGDYKTVPFRWPSPTGVSDQVKEDFQIPTLLSFQRIDSDQIISVEGQSKQDFADKFAGASSFKAEDAEGAYSGEFQRSFKTEYDQEDFCKYAIAFRQVALYSFSLTGDPIELLSDHAKAHFDPSSESALNASKLVDTYGTHFTKTAIFGGLRICAAKADIHDRLEANELTQALSIKASGALGKASADGSSTSDRVKKIHEAMTVTYTGHFGGQAETADDDKWRASVNLTPVLVGYELEPLSALVKGNEQLQKEIDDEIAKRVGRKPLKTYPLVAMRVDISLHASDKGCGAGRDISVARPAPIPGWYYVGQWALPTWDSFPSGFQALVFKNWPGTEGAASTAIKPPKGFDRRWGKSSSWGLFSASQEDGYASVGDLFENTDDANGVPDRVFYGIVRSDLVEDCGNYITYGVNQTLWQDSGSRANDDGSAWAFWSYDDPNTPESQKQIFDTVGTGQWPHMFVAVSGYDKPANAKRIKPDSYSLLPGRFIFG